MDQFGTGAIKSKLDERDHQWEEVGFGVSPFDWTTGYDAEKELAALMNKPDFIISPKDQNGSGSCGGQAWSYYSAVQEAFYDKSYQERSAKFVYAQTHGPMGGSDGRDNSALYKAQGVSEELLCPSYDHGMAPSEAFMIRPQDITAVARENARLNRATSYVSVSPDIDSIAQALKANHGIVIGVDGSNNGTWLSLFPQKPVAGEVIWRHWLFVFAAKMINGKKHLGVINSWGSNPGENGKQWLSEDYVKATVYDTFNGFSQACVWEAWSLVHNDNPASPDFTHNFATDIKFNTNGEEVVALQKALQLEGGFPLGTPTTGYYGDITRRAVLAFRIKYGIDTSTDPQGKNVGPKTRAQLNKLYNK